MRDMRTYLTTNIGEQNLVSMEFKNWDQNGTFQNQPGNISSNATINQYFTENIDNDGIMTGMGMGLGAIDEMAAMAPGISEGQSTTNT